MRIYEVARSFNKTSKDIIELLKEWGYPVKNHMSTVDDRAQFLIQEWIQDHKEKGEKEESEAGSEAVSKVEETVVEQKGKEEEIAALQEAQIEVETEEKKEVEIEEEEEEAVVEKEVSIVEVDNPVSVRTMAEILEQPVTVIIKQLMQQGLMVTINQAVELEVAQRIAEKYHVLLSEKGGREKTQLDQFDTEAERKPKPPVVSVMGHVDHGKTKLLDSIRQTRVADKEHGGITQHIGGSSIVKEGKRIIFLDTPGHEAFTALRARGAQVTDLVVLVVAADDGVMPQTVEAIDHARAAGAPIIVAINKMDKEGANPEKVQRQLAEKELIPEKWGGETIMVEVSAKTGQGIDELLEMILLQAEVLELKSCYIGHAQGTVIESQMEKKKGPSATLLVQRGRLAIGDALVAGTVYGKVRNMWSDEGKRVSEVDPGQPIVEVIGLNGLPRAGDRFQVMSSEKEAKIVAEQEQEKDKAQITNRRMTLEKVTGLMEKEDLKEITLVCRADTQGSLEGLLSALQKLERENLHIHCIHQAIGELSASDVLLASASSAIVIGFCVKCPASVLKIANMEGVQVRLYDVIYAAVEDFEKSIEGLLEERTEEVVLGQAEVKAIFSVPKLGQVAGCVIKEGIAQRGSQFRLLRNGEELGTFSLDSLRRFKEDVREVSSGKECGIGSFGFKKFQEGDILEVFIVRKV